MFRAHHHFPRAILAAAAAGLPVCSAQTEHTDPGTNQSTIDPAPAWPAILLVDDTRHPEVSLRWHRSDGEVILTGRRPYLGDPQRTLLGDELEAYVAVGGTRLGKSAGHPRGAIVRVGFYKKDNDRPFFDAVTPGSRIDITLDGVRFNQPVHANPDAPLQHLKYDPVDLESCGLPGDAREQFNLVSRTDTLNDRTRPGIDTRQGAFAAGAPDAVGTITIEQVDGFTLRMRASFDYAALRNMRDPWRSDLPGTFLEPYHFHIEFEVLPASVPVPPPPPQRSVPTRPSAFGD